MPLFSLSKDWDSNQTGDELCESFLKDSRGKKKSVKKNKRKLKSRTLESNNSLPKRLGSENRNQENICVAKAFKNIKNLVLLREKKGDEASKSLLTFNGKDDSSSDIFQKISISKKKNGKVKNIKKKRSLSETKDTIMIEDEFDQLPKKRKNNENEYADEKQKNAEFELTLTKNKAKKKKKKKKRLNGDSSAVCPKVIDKKLEKLQKIMVNEEKKKIHKSDNQKSLKRSTIDPAQLKKRHKQLEQLRGLLEKQKKQNAVESKGEEPVLTLRQRMMQKLKAARFRFLNEQIYTTTSKETEKIFKRDPEAFKAYHQGYRQQVKKWPVNPLDRIIKAIKKMPKIHIIADFGCGEARLARSVEQEVHSFDLVAVNDNVIACDMAHVPLKDSSVDVVVFCLSLMGTNLKDYLLEANRVLKKGGLLKIAEVESRFDDIKSFIKDCEQFGFKKLWMDLSHNLFYFLDFKKENSCKGKKKLPSITLQPCLYKKR